MEAFVQHELSGIDNEKELYIYGMGVFGSCILYSLINNGFNVKGIIDERADGLSKIAGIQVFNVEILNTLNEKKAIILITASTPYSINSIVREILNYENKNKKKYEYIILQSGGEVYIDISGVCNLRCASCPVGNNAPETFTRANRGFMKPDLYKKILSKLKIELPNLKNVFLYIYGDPLLSPYLSEIVEITHQMGMYAIVSTNMSMELDFKKLIEQIPDCIKVSTSGFTQEIYSSTHNGGNVNLVKANLYKLRYMLDKANIEGNVFVGYHKYRNNEGSEYEAMKALCKELNYVFQEKQGLYFNLKKIFGHIPFSGRDIEFINAMYYDAEKYLEPKKKEWDNSMTCGYLDDDMKSLFIDWDGSVMLCCNFRSDDSIFPYSYLDVSIDRILEDRRKHYLCKECMEYGFSY